ncbi:retrovirus-related pol polyprotein from transposon TNT 1-94 [Tanacetum coccineum]
MSTSNQQTLADSGANERPPMHKKENYISWESRFRRFLDNKLEVGDQMWRLIEKGPYVRPMISNLDKPTEQIFKPFSKMTEGNKKQYTADVKVMNYLFQAIPNDIYNLVDASKEGESLESVYERLITLVNIMDRNNVRPIPVEPHVLASRAKKATKNHDPLALLANSNAYSSQSHANSSYSPQPYYTTHPSSIVDYEDEYQRELQGDSQEDKLTFAMMLLARAITQKFSTPTNNHLRTSSNTRNQAVIQVGRVDIQINDAGYGGNSNRNAGRQNNNQAFNVGTGNDESNQIVHCVPRTESTLGKANGQCYNCVEKGHYARDCQKPRVRDAKYFREQMLLAMKDEAGSNLKDEENDFMLDNSYRDETLKELTTAVIMMAQIQPANRNAESEPSYDAKDVSEVNASNKVHEQVNLVKRKTIIHTSDDDQIHFNIIFDDPYVENVGIKRLIDDLRVNAVKFCVTVAKLKQKNEMLRNELEKSSSDSNDIQAIYSKELKFLKMILSEHKLKALILNSNYNIKKEKMACDVSWKSRLSTLNDENVLLKTQADSLDELIEHVDQKTYAYADVWTQNQDLLMTITELKNKLKTIKKWKNVNTKFDKFESSRTLLCVTPLPKNIAVKAKKVSNTKVNADRSKLVTLYSIPKNKQSQKQSANVIARGKYRITKTETQTPDFKTNMNVSNSIGVESPNSVRRPKSKDTKSKDRVLKNINDKRSSAHVRKKSSSVRIDSNKRGTMHSNVCQSKASVLNTKIVNVVNDCSNIVYVSCGKDVFLLSHETYVTRYALSRYTKVKRALFTTSIAARSKNLGATSVVAKSRLCVAKTPTTTNKVIQLVLWIVDSGCWKHMIGNLSLLRNFIEKFMGTVYFGNDHFAAITGYGDYV